MNFFLSRLVGTMQSWFKIGTHRLNSSTELEVKNSDGSAFATLKAYGVVLTNGAGSGKVLTSDGSGNASWQAPGAAAPNQAMLSFEGTCTVVANPLKIYNVTGVSRTISKVFLAVGTAPTGAALIVDVKVNGTSIWTSNPKPQINASATTGSVATIDSPTWADGNYITVEITQIGSTVAGSNLTVHIVYS